MTVVKKTCAMTGDPLFLLPYGFYRENRVDALRHPVLRQTENAVLSGCRQFLCGFTAGVDFLFAEAVLKLRDKYSGITLESVLAYEYEAAWWEEPIRERYYRLLARCDAEHLLQTRYSAGCLARRNRFLVDHADILLAASDGLLGNPQQAIQYAAARGKPVICISPSTLAARKIG